MKSTIRLALASLCLSSWLILLLTGFALGGWIHGLLAAAVVLFPWRSESS